MKTRWHMLRVGPAVALLWLAMGSGGCVFGEESEPPVLTVELYWEYDIRSNHDWGCGTVPVGAAEWHLRNADGEVLQELGPDDETCKNTLRFLDLDPGQYDLEVAGYNEDGDKAWEGTCSLATDRFDRLAECTIHQIEP